MPWSGGGEEVGGTSEAIEEGPGRRPSWRGERGEERAEDEAAENDGRDAPRPNTNSCREASFHLGDCPFRFAERRTAFQDFFREENWWLSWFTIPTN